MEEAGSENLNPEEVRKRRLAYFQSITDKDKPTVAKVESTPARGHAPQNHVESAEKNTSKEQVQFTSQNRHKADNCRTDDGDVPKLQLSHESNGQVGDGYDETVERLIQLTKKEMAEKYANRKDSPKGDLTPKQTETIHEKVNNSVWSPSQSSSREEYSNSSKQNKPSQNLRHFQPQPANDLHVEEIFSERNNSFRPKHNPQMATSLRESHENGAHIFQKSVDVNQVEELGLSTHRPEDVQKSKDLHERSPRALNESMSEELKYALGEKKYKEFLEKSMKDIDALYGDNIKSKTKGGKFEKRGTKDINVRRDQYDKVTNSLMGLQINETVLTSQNDSSKSTDRLLNRPKNEPVTIYQGKRGFDNDEGVGVNMSRSKSIDESQSVSSKNFAFSADEIYSQAYQPNAIQSVPINVSGGLGHGHPVQQQPFSGMSGVGHSHSIPHGFQPHPGLYHSHSYDGSMMQSPHSHYPSEHFMSDSPPGYFVQHPYGSPESYPHRHPSMRTSRMMSHSPNQKGDNQMPHNSMMSYYPHPHYDDSPGRQISARNIHSMDPQEIYRFRQQHPQMFPHPPEEYHFDSEMKPHPPSVKMSQSSPYFHPSMARVQHPPESPPSSWQGPHGPSQSARPGPHGDMSAFQDYLHMMPKGIPYPPPPSDIELQTYFQYVGSQGYPIPYQTVMPPDSPRDDQGMMVPHPPAEKKETKPGSSHFRRRDMDSSRDKSVHEGSHDKHQHEGSPQKDDMKKSIDDRSDELSSSQRHIEGIRQFHEQRRHQQEHEMLEKQRTFAKESIDRYFTSLEHHSSKQQGQDFTDKPMEILRESLTDVQTLVNSEATGVTLNAGGITERMDELGIDLSYLKQKDQENSENTYKNKGDNPKTRTVIVCPECGEVNKPYMTWCSECSEVLIGVEPVKVKPKRKGGRGKKSGENSDKNYVLYKSVTFDEPKNSELDENISDNDQEVKEVELSHSKLSPSKSEGRDSGRPSSDDLDLTRTENEIDEICQSLSDPVIKGFIKAYFNKKRQEVTKKNDNEGIIDSENRHDSEERSTKRTSSTDKVNSEDEKVMEENLNERHQFRHVANDEFSEIQLNKEVSNGFHSNDIDHSKQIENNYFHPIESKQNPDWSHKDQHLHNEEVWLHEQKSPRYDAPMGRKHMPIDIEVFTLEESRQGKITQRDPLVPSLNLANSSDEDENGIKIEKKPFVPLSMSAESEDWNEFFTNGNNFEIPQEEPILESPNTADSESKPFLERLLEHQPKMSKKPPSSSSKTCKSNPNVKSVVKESIDAPFRQRKWAKSSTAWNSYNPRELSTKPSVNKTRPISAGNKIPTSGGTRPAANASASNSGIPRRSGSIPNLSLQSTEDVTPGRKKVSKFSRPVSADLSSTRSEESKGDVTPDLPVRRTEVASQDFAVGRNEVPTSQSVIRKKEAPSTSSKVDTKNKDSPKSLPYVIDHRLPAEEIEPVKDIGKLQSAYSMYQEMTPRIQQGKFSAWLCLPDEIMLQIFSFLSHADLVEAALTCKQYYRVALDETLWRYITVKKKHDMDDETLADIGHRHPVSLALIQCHGDNITAKGLRELFRECCETLRELNLCGCSRGALTGDCILLHASARCHNLTHVDASWCMVTDSGIGAISSSCKRLESLCINGCQNITDEGLETVLKKHGSSLRVLEMFGCFKITPKGIRYLATHCINLLTLNLGQCYKLKDSCISQLSTSLGRIECLDLRGVKHIKDNCIRYVVKNCPRLKTIVMANCPNISDVALLEISTYLSDIRVIDVCGCRNITDSSIRALSNNCQNLRNIDISSTGCTQRSVSMLANFCNQRLEEAKLNFLADVTDAVVIKLVKHCKKLKLLHLYGCTSIKDIKKIQELNQDLKVEM
ncbi:unnamed protein product [Mytilus coruscus]|uniref:F-box domain-containing protein n=1 Tax=Mytilus coruscus TaxID=42192 RepID=A0A6J8C2Q1_MYTCO|nr:unnamed protein product [Mytilus coruscus]